MDDRAHREPGAPDLEYEPLWMTIFDVLYAHTRLWPSVPSRSRAVARWLRRLVDLEVCFLLL